MVAVILAVFTGAFGTARAGFGRVCRGFHLVEAHAARAIHHGTGGHRAVEVAGRGGLEAHAQHALRSSYVSLVLKPLAGRGQREAKGAQPVERDAQNNFLPLFVAMFDFCAL